MPPQNSSPATPSQPAPQPSRPAVEFSPASANQELKIPTPPPAPIQNQVTPPPPAPPQPQKRSPLSRWATIIFVLVVLIVGGLYFLGSASGPQSKPITGLEVALKTTNYLDKNLKADGSLWGGHLCDNAHPEICYPKELSAEMPHVGQAVFSYFMLAEASQDPAHRVKADKAVNFILDACDTDVRMCEWNFFPISQYYFKTSEDKYLTRGMLRPAEDFLNRTDENVILGNVGHKLASLYNATEDIRFRDKLVSAADSEIERPLGARQGKSVEHDIQLVWSIYLPAYKITGDQRYLAKAEELFDNYNIADDLERYRLYKTVAVGIKAGDALLELAEVSDKREAYRAQAKVLLQFFIDILWDTPERRMYNGDYGFIENGTNDPQAYKATLQNGWLMKLFIMMGDETFQTPVNTDEV